MLGSLLGYCFLVYFLSVLCRSIPHLDDHNTKLAQFSAYRTTMISSPFLAPQAPPRGMSYRSAEETTSSKESAVYRVSVESS